MNTSIDNLTFLSIYKFITMNKPANTTRSIVTLRTCLIAALMGVISGCEQAQLPVGAELIISPESRTINIADRRDANGNCIVDSSRYLDVAVVLSLVNAEGSPLADAEVRVYVDWSGNTFPGYPVMALYDDRRGNNNGIIDDFELVTGVGDDVAVVKTDYYGGDRPLLLRLNLSCPYKGNIFAFSDGISVSSNIDIVVDEPLEQN